VITIVNTPDVYINTNLQITKKSLDFGEDTEENKNKILGENGAYKRYLLEDDQGNYSSIAIKFKVWKGNNTWQYYILKNNFIPFDELSGSEYKLKYVLIEKDDEENVHKTEWENLTICDTGIVIDSQTYEPTIRNSNDGCIISTGGNSTNNNNSNNSKDEVNLPLIIGASVGGFVLLAIILYFFMRKGKSSRGSKKVSNNRMNANRGGAKKAGRGRSK
tara:strand:+ start:10422 stop:11075 length:654 start_codon:yes stop_codon:yes gene_type:complete